LSYSHRRCDYSNPSCRLSEPYSPIYLGVMLSAAVRSAKRSSLRSRSIPTCAEASSRGGALLPTSRLRPSNCVQ